MRYSVISLLTRSAKFSRLAGKQQGAILDEQGIWLKAAPMVAINPLPIFRPFVGLTTLLRIGSSAAHGQDTSQVICDDVLVRGFVRNRLEDLRMRDS
jgi:hypothetical protein